MVRFLRKIRGNQQGTMILEYALIFPVFALLFLGTFEMALLWWGNGMLVNTISQVAFESTRGCKEGDYDKSTGVGQGNCLSASSSITIGNLNNLITKNGLGLIDPTKLCFTAGVMGVDAPAEAIPAPQINLGKGDDTVIIYASYKWPVFFGIMYKVLGADTDFKTLVVVRNEDFGLLPNVVRSSPRSGACS